MSSQFAVIGVVITAAASMLAVACQRNAAANQSNESSSSPAPIVAAEQAPRARYDEAAFSLSIAPKATLTRGQPAELAIQLLAKAPYHVNQEYPHRFKITGMKGLSVTAQTVERDPKRLTAEQLELLVPVTVGSDNPLGLDGELSFSLCTAEKCLMEKRKLSLVIPNG